MLKGQICQYPDCTLPAVFGINQITDKKLVVGNGLVRYREANWLYVCKYHEQIIGKENLRLTKRRK